MNKWHKTFLGVRQQHNYALYWFIDRVLKDSPIERFVEIGTGGGALSVVLGLHAVQRGTHLLTFDIQVRGYKSKLDRVFEALGIEFVQKDAFKAEAQIIEHIDNRPCLFVCDGGHKAREFNTFSKLVPKDSIVVVHDYGVAFQLEELDTAGFVPLLDKHWNDGKYKLRTCFFRKE